MPKEIEAKLRVADLDRVRQTLVRLGAEDRGECLERNWILDDAAGSLYARGVLLRVRREGEDGVLTVKLPAEAGEFKVREEIETSVGSPEVLLRQLEAVGFRTAWIYEKIRHTWLWRGCAVLLDRCPEIGDFVEIEGSPEAIRAVAADLGLDPGAHIGDNYLGLWIRHLESRGEGKRDMIFPPGIIERFNRRAKRADA